MNLIGWPLGFLTNVPEIMYLATYKIVYSKSYITNAACRLNYTYVEKNNQCIVDTHGKTVLFTTNVITLLLIATIWALLLVVVYRARSSYRRNSRQAELEANNSVVRMTGSSVARDYSLKIYKCSLQFSIPSLVYSFAFLPIICVSFYEIYNGPVHNFANFALTFWVIFDGVFIAICNIIFYGFLSTTFRSEMTIMFRHFFLSCEKLKLRFKVKQPREFSVNGCDIDDNTDCLSPIGSDDAFNFESDDGSNEIYID